MAKKVTTTTDFIDDLDGGKAEGSVSFTLSGKAYEIDLSKKNRTALEKLLKPYIEAGRPVRNGRGTSRPAQKEKRSDLAEVRAWASANGYAVSERGRVPNAVIEAFDSKG